MVYRYKKKEKVLNTVELGFLRIVTKTYVDKLIKMAFKMVRKRYLLQHFFKIQNVFLCVSDVGVYWIFIAVVRLFDVIQSSFKKKILWTTFDI